MEEGYIPDKIYSIKSLFTAVIVLLNINGVHCWMPSETQRKGMKILKGISLIAAAVSVLISWMQVGRVWWMIDWKAITSTTEATKAMLFLMYVYSAALHLSMLFSFRKHIVILLDKLESSHVRYSRRAMMTMKILTFIYFLFFVIYCVYSLYKVTAYVRSDTVLTHIRMFPLTRGTQLWDIYLILYCVYMKQNIFHFNIVCYMLVLISYHLREEFKVIADSIQDVQSPGLFFFERLKKQFEKVVKFMNTVDNLLSFAAFLSFAFSIPLLCFATYACIRWDVTEVDVQMLFNSLSGAVLLTIMFLVTGTYIHSVSMSIVEPLLRIEMARLGEMTSRSMLVSRVSTCKVGITAFGLFVIDKSTILTLVGTIITYIVVVLQFSPAAVVLENKPGNESCS